MDMYTEKKKISAGTIARLIGFAVVWINMLLKQMGIVEIPLDPETVSSWVYGIYDIGSEIATFIMTCITTYKDTPLTQAGRKAHDYMLQLKGRK